MTHVKPTKEELQAKADQALKEIEEMDKAEQAKKEESSDNLPADDNKDKKESEDIEKETGKDIEDENNDDDAGDDDVEEDKDKKEEKKDNPPADDKKEEEDKDKKETKSGEGDDAEKEDKEDWQKRYADSTRQEQISRLKEQKLSEAYEKSAQVPEPTEDELKAEFPNWDELSEFEKKMAKKTLHNDKRFSLIENTRKEIKQFENWQKKVDEFVKDPRTLVTHPDLEGKIDSFKIYASKEKRIDKDFTDMVNSFLYLVSKQRVQHKGKMFETGSGGSKERQTPKQQDKLSPEQSASLRKSNYRLWKQYLDAGKIDNSSIL